MGEYVALLMLCLGLIPKMLLELFFFKEPESSVKTLCYFAFGVLCLSISLGFTFLFNYYG